MNTISTIILDIESTALYADLGVALCMSYESSEDPGVVHTLRTDKLNPRDWKRGVRGNDRELVKRCNEVIRNHDIVVAHNGKWFDLPFLRTRALVHGLAPLHEVTIVDPVLIARRKFRFQRNSLARIADTLKLADKKTPLDLSLWADVCLNGNQEGMDLIVEHCEADVRVLSGVLGLVKPFVKQFDNRGSDR